MSIDLDHLLALIDAVPPAGESATMGGPIKNRYCASLLNYASEDGYPRTSPAREVQAVLDYLWEAGK